MRISANLTDGYILNPEKDELSAFSRVYVGLLKPCASGWGYKSLDKVPSYLVKGAVYFDSVAKITRSYATKTKTLTALNLVIENKTGLIINALSGVAMPANSRISFDSLNYSANHIPQLLALTDYGAINSINGDFCFKYGVFKGLINFSSLTEIFKNEAS